MKKDVNNFFRNVYESNQKLHQQVQREYLDVQIKNLEQRRALIGNIPGFSAIVITLSAQLISKDTITTNYLVTGLILNLISIFFILSYLREKLDSESLALEEQKRKYSEILDNEKQIIFEILKKDEPTIEEYEKNISNSPIIKKLKSEYKQYQESYDKRKQNMEYSSEIAISLFVTASFFVLASMLNWQFSRLNLILILLFILFISFNNFSTLITNLISKIINWFKNINKKIL